MTSLIFARTLKHIALGDAMKRHGEKVPHFKNGPKSCVTGSKIAPSQDLANFKLCTTFVKFTLGSELALSYYHADFEL